MAATTEFRRAEGVMMSRAASARAAEEWPYTVALIPITYLTVDDRYQRPRQEAFIKKGIAEFEPSLVGVLDVTPSRGDRYAVLDGRQRLGMMEGVGKTAVWCAVYSEMDLREQAAFFYKKNKDRKTMKPYYAFRARVVSEDSVATRVLAICHGCGFDVGPVTNDEDVVGAIKSLTDAFSMSSDNRNESLTPTLITIRESVFGRAMSTNGELIRGLARFWQNYSDDEVDMARLAQAIGAHGPQAVLGFARDRGYGSTGHGASSGWQVARVVAEEYNKASRRGKLDLAKLAL